MSHIYTGAIVNNPTSITLVDDGDPPNAAGVTGVEAALFDKARYTLEGATRFTGVKTLAGAPPSILLEDSGGGGPVTYVRGICAYYINDSSGSVVIPSVNLAAGNAFRTMPSGFPNGAELSEVYVAVDPATGVYPGTPLSLTLQRTSRAGVTSVLATLLDGVTGAAYLAPHEAIFSEFAQVLDLTQYTYELVLNGEVAPNAGNVSIKSYLFCSYKVSAVDLAR